MPDDCYYRCSAKGLVLDKNGTHFLIIQDSSNFWDLPGGGIEYDAIPTEELAREILEETGIKIKACFGRPIDFITGRRTLQPDVHIANIVYLCEIEKLVLRESAECVAARFVSPADVSQLRASDLLKDVAARFVDYRIDQG
ncbi:NUDIX domain-containing protein [Erythrobacter sp.]|uniref:NUDIX domain-containing protein n=1 Tax=Erythrobacter sp. TaxID=1042 RepID=UPI001B263586|nr:NUDIX domain-containing protein [Erythrobacter sp.]MBO6530275.1 NUDIX domain-containing protein [Erythrobacter sp.]